MRILLHGINYSPELTGIGKYSGEMAESARLPRAWCARSDGAAVLPRVAGAPDYRAWSYKTEAGTGPCGVRVYRCPIFVPRRPRD